MRQLTRTRPALQAGVVAALTTLLATGLLVAVPSPADASTGVPTVESTDSVPVGKAGGSGGTDDSAAMKNRNLPTPQWPDAGDTVTVDVNDEFAGSGDIIARAEDPQTAPDQITVESLGKLPANDLVGPGVAFTVKAGAETPSSGDAEPSNPDQVDPGTADVPLDGTALANPAIYSSLGRFVQDPTPGPNPSPSPESTEGPDDQEADPPPDEPEESGPEQSAPDTDDTESGPVQIQFDYSDYAGAVGGNWSSRLQAVQLDGCETIDGQLSCDSATPLPSTNDTEKQTLTATVSSMSATSGSTTMALTATSSGPEGTYDATPLSPNSAWSSGGNSGDFTWNYPFDVPPGAGGPEPDLSINYSSGSVDGRTESTNNQTSVIGEGFSLSNSFIERTYTPCQEDKTNSSAPSGSRDLCWDGDNLTIAFGGKSTRLIEELDENGHRTGLWHMMTDDGSRIVRKTGSANGAQQGEYFELTTTDGTRYYFGKNKVSDADTRSTNSVSNVRVFGNQSGEPCPGSSCIQGWRWSLDYVVDPSGNSMTYFYDQEENYYGAAVATYPSKYDRASRLVRIEYGTRSDNEGAQAPAEVNFDYLQRCIPTENESCAPGHLSEDTASYWPDVPYDRICNEGSEVCAGRTSPTFFTNFRLSKVTTSIWTGTGTVYKPVDSWTFDHIFPHTGDGTDRSLWLRTIQRTGGSGTGAITLPEVSFSGEQLQNRVDAQEDGIAPFQKWRVRRINNGYGGAITINYSSRDCSANDKPAAVDFNTRLCFPTYYQPNFAEDKQLEFFHKYVVTSVVESDKTGGAPNVSTKYTYVGTPSWHFDDSYLALFKNRTWSDWRGYQKVITQVGGTGTETWSESMYLRGMHDDRTAAGGHTTVVITPDSGTDLPAISDWNQYNGYELRTTTKLGASGDTLATTWNIPTTTLTAENGDYRAKIVNTRRSQTTTPITGSADRVTEVNNTFDSGGRPTQTWDRGDIGATVGTSDDRCTNTTYATNDTAWIRDTVATQTTTAGTCEDLPTSADDVISATQTLYDGASTVGAAPTRGLATTEKSASGWANGIDYQVDATRVYDDVGRVTSQIDALNHTITTTYGETYGVPTQVTTTNTAVDHATTQKLNREWGSVDESIDVAGHKTTSEYDALGRVVRTWVPGREKSGSQAPVYVYDYKVDDDKPNRITTKVLNAAGDYVSTSSFFDGLLRARETQAPAAGPDGGRLITENRYDSHGRLESARGPYFNEAEVGEEMVQAPTGAIPAYTDYTFDRADRPVATIAMSKDAEKFRTTTSYGGDRTSVTPPAGGTATTTVVDARGQTRELRQYEAPTPTGDFDGTTYTYTPAGQLKTITNAEGTQWSYGYDIRGRQVTADDPDKGITTTTYDALDRVVSTTDANDHTLWTKYDGAGRKTELRDDDSDGNLRASWTYDQDMKGTLSSSTRHTSDGDYTTSLSGYDSAARPTVSKLTVPESLGPLYRAGGYVTKTAYNSDGSVHQVEQPSTTGTGVTNEVLRYTYDRLGNVQTLTGAGAIVAGTTLTPFGEVAQRALGSTIGKTVYDSREYQASTRRLERQSVALQTSATQTQLDLRYTYDDAGNITSTDDLATTEAAPFRQCFDYDYLRRLTAAWTSDATGCAAPTTTNLGSEDPYWDRYTYSLSGNRLSEISIRGTGASAVTTTKNSAYPAPTADRPHAVSAVTTIPQTGPQTVEDFAYDSTGNLTGRDPSTGDESTTTWDREGHTKTVTNTATGEVTSFVYDADGTRLVKHDDATDSTTLYVGASEYTATGTTLSLTRNYSLGSEPVATRTSAGLTVTVGDRQGTGALAINSTTLAVDKRRLTPFGEPLDTPVAWVNDRGYLNKTTDTSTGTTHLDAREYDPTLGRFTSVDPVLAPLDPQQLNGYAYANNNPVTMTDPNGLMQTCGEMGAACSGSGGKTKSHSSSNDVIMIDQEQSLVKKASKKYGINSATARKIQNNYDRWLRALRGVDAREPIPFSTVVAKVFEGVKNIAYEDALDTCGEGFSASCVFEAGTALPTPAKFLKFAKVADDIHDAAKIEDAAKTGGVGPVRVGQAGEDAVRSAYRIGEKTPFNVLGRDRIADGMTATTISEVKNVGYQGYTQQLKDYVTYSIDHGLQFDLYVRRGTKLSRPLQEAIGLGQINRKYIK